MNFVGRNTGALVSRLVTLVDDLAAQGDLNKLSDVLWKDQWEDFRCYVAHLWAEKKNLDAVLADTDQLLRQTYGYTALRNDPAQREKADALLEAAQAYARKLARQPSGIAELADSTGFSPEGVRYAMAGVGGLETRLLPSDWVPEGLFGDNGRMAELFGIMLKVPQLKKSLDEVGGAGFDHELLSNITRDWVNGKNIDVIAREYFARDKDDDGATAAITDACKAIYRSIVNSGTWGISALFQISDTGSDELSEDDRRRLNALPAMIYHGVRTEDAVLMRMNSVPRGVAPALGNLYRDLVGNDGDRYSIGKARTFLRNLKSVDWDGARPQRASLSGDGYRRVWEVLAGEIPQ